MDGPPPIKIATPIASIVCCLVAPAFNASWTWNAIHPSQCTAMAIPSAINSFDFVSRAPSATAEECNEPKPLAQSQG